MNEWIFMALAIGLPLICFIAIPQCAEAKDDGSLQSALDTMIGHQVRDAGDYSVQFTVKDSPTGQRVYDAQGNWLYKIEGNTIYNMDRDRVFNITDPDPVGE